MIVQFTEEEIQQMGSLAKFPYWPEILLHFEIGEDKTAQLKPHGDKYLVSIWSKTLGFTPLGEDELTLFTLAEASIAIMDYINVSK